MTFSVEWSEKEFPLLSIEKERLSGERGAFRRFVLDAVEHRLSRGEPQSEEERMLAEILRIVKSGSVALPPGEPETASDELTASDKAKLDAILKGFE